MRIDDNIVLVPVRMTELGSEQTATRLEHTPDIITVNVRAAGFNRDLVDNFLSCKLQIGVRDFRINDEASEGRKLRETNALLRRVDDANPNEAIFIRACQARGNHNGQTL